jgi:hypothetical protein
LAGDANRPLLRLHIQVHADTNEMAVRQAVI